MSTMSGADPDLLDELGRELTASAQQLLALQGRLTARVQQAPWQGRDADRVRAQWSARHARAVAGAAGELERAAATVSGNATDQRRASAADGGAIGALGLVGGGVTGTVGAALHVATGAGLTGATGAGLTGATGAAFLSAGGGVAAAPPVSIPAAITAWWNGLTPAQRDELIRTQPGLIGNLDGVPVVDRDRANRANLPQLTAGLQSQLDALNAQEPANYIGADGEQNPQWLDWQQRTGDLQRRLGGLHALSATLAAGAGDDPPLYLIGVQDVGNGRGIVSRGNPDTAAHVVTLVPGITTTLSGIGVGVDRSNAMFDATQAATPGADSHSTAAITWYGYDAPQGLDALSSDSARAGAPLLDSFQSGLRATHQGAPSVNTVVAHSYAGGVVGFAAAPGSPLDADNIVFVAPTDSGQAIGVQGLQLSGIPTDQNGSHVYATRDAYDPATFASVLNGQLPTDSGYGAHIFTSDPHPDGDLPYNVGAHSDYWEPGDSSLVNLGKVIAGHGDQTH